MSVYKDEKTGTWRAVYRYTDWNGEKKQTQKRGFKTKREAQSWEREQLIKSSADLDMTFKSFVELILYWLHAALWVCSKKALDSKQKTRPRRPACLSLLPHLFPFYDPCHARRGRPPARERRKNSRESKFPCIRKIVFLTNTYHQKIASLLPMAYAIRGQIAKHLPKIWRKKWVLGGARLYNPQKNDPV